MIGDNKKKIDGLYYLAAKDIFEALEADYPDFEIHVSYFEIYCGKLFDLLNKRKTLFAREDDKKAIIVVGLER